jgi:hypothetical protein
MLHRLPKHTYRFVVSVISKQYDEWYGKVGTEEYKNEYVESYIQETIRHINNNDFIEIFRIYKDHSFPKEVQKELLPYVLGKNNS